MTILALLVRFFWILLIILGVRLVWRALAPLFAPRAARPETPPRRPAGRMQRGEAFRDPICGTWVDGRIALTASRDGRTEHFCSAACRDRFLAEEPR
jgi:YHS domain-containing protein